ncbi:hypothetical protein EDD18DRAFT_245990 [Armillaria luteobubalina]|uniref:Uncharacterized protein n=1 Tax=Armillaria luteobubalina TaxID=153913 RepID=A0AA39Q4B4_9AGAR|nr:hypothetical protein EDD18DRAFT_245990 [Armillaria luteobubalina]
MMRSETLPNPDQCLACRLPVEKVKRHKVGLSSSCAIVQTTQRRCTCPKKYEAPPEEPTVCVEPCVVQTDFPPCQPDFFNTDTGRRMSRPFLRPNASQHPNNGARVEDIMSGRYATTRPGRPSPSTSGGFTGASDHITLPIINDDYSQWHCPLSGDNGQRGASSTWPTSAHPEISPTSLFHSHPDPLSRFSDSDNRKRYQPYTRPGLLRRYTRESDKLQPVKFSTSVTSPQTFLAKGPEKNALGIPHHNHEYSPPSPVLASIGANHRFLGLRDSLANTLDHHRRLPPLNVDREGRRSPFLRRPHIRYRATSPDIEDRHEDTLNRYQLPTPPENSPLHPSPLPPNFRGFSDDHRPWRSRYNYPPREVSRERDHRDVRGTPKGLPTPISNSPVHRTLLEDSHSVDNIPPSNIADMSLGMADSTRARNDGFTRPKVLHSAFEDAVFGPSQNKKIAASSRSLPAPINDLPIREALFDSNHSKERFQTSGVSTTSMTTDTPIHDSPHDGMQPPDGSVYEPPSPPNVPQPIVTLPISGPQAASTSYGLPTSDDEEVDQLAEDDPQPAPVYSRFQFMPRNTTSRTYKTIFYPNDDGPPISPWNTRAMMALADPDHSSIYDDIRRMHFHEKCSKVDSLDTVEPGRVSRPQLFYDSSMSETVQNSPYPRLYSSQTTISSINVPSKLKTYFPPSPIPFHRRCTIILKHSHCLVLPSRTKTRPHPNSIPWLTN